MGPSEMRDGSSATHIGWDSGTVICANRRRFASHLASTRAVSELGEWKYQAEPDALGDFGVPQRDRKAGGAEAHGVIGRLATQEAVGFQVLRFAGVSVAHLLAVY